ncbi:MAG: ABC transporter ATP-binding protein [Oscillatoriophycideae cyanobacterium NC_groundwater_1537_Pr4_S-0.65um_50_18]|nr:ABC transporter ATP-binding protein [Oscillatoriophycideae cyanobacterium NC_groundwater_1537_Pr4_S-0.65um_50_18]
MSYLELIHLFKSYGSVTAVQDVNLQIPAGEFISLLGPSGCGKTTILRMIAGFEKATGGSILLEGQDITHIPANRRDMGMVFQSYSLFPHMTAGQNIAFGLRVKRLSHGQQRIRIHEMLDLVGLAGMGDRYPHQMSGGQQQRIALARALAISPRLLLLDEPLSALDAKVRLQLRNEIRRIQQQLGITTLFVTHDQEEALSISDRVIVMSQGRIDQAGTPEEIYLTPNTAFTASFIGAMNQIPGIWEGHQVRVSTHPDTHIPDEFLRTQAMDLPKGAHVLVLVRPESITVLTPGSSISENDNLLSGLVTSRIFLGSVVRLSVLVGEFYLNVDVPTGQAEQFSSGHLVQLEFPADQCRVLAIAPPSVQPTSPQKQARSAV